MVFTIAHGDHDATWVNTAFDPVNGKIQYVYVIPKVVATVITLTLQAHAEKTAVHVRYERTSLSPGAGGVVREMAKRDASAGEEWASQIKAYLMSGLIR